MKMVLAQINKQKVAETQKEVAAAAKLEATREAAKVEELRVNKLLLKHKAEKTFCIKGSDIVSNLRFKIKGFCCVILWHKNVILIIWCVTNNVVCGKCSGTMLRRQTRCSLLKRRSIVSE
jgi:hypothetical protein